MVYKLYGLTYDEVKIVDPEIEKIISEEEYESWKKNYDIFLKKMPPIEVDFISKNNPLYLLCFASGNPKGAKTAIKIAQDILRR